MKLVELVGLDEINRHTERKVAPKEKIIKVEDMEINALTVGLTVGGLAVANYVSVFSALATLRWADARKKKMLVNAFIEQVGEKLQTEADFQNIINNLRMQDPDPEEGTDNDR